MKGGERVQSRLERVLGEKRVGGMKGEDRMGMEEEAY